MVVEALPIAGPMIVTPRQFSDERGTFFEVYHEARYSQLGLVDRFVQDNCSFSRQGTIRGLHYQVGSRAQGKLGFVLHGTVLDVAVDLRLGSPTYGQHVAVELSAENRRQLWVPPGFAHGISVLSDEAVFVYKCTQNYSAVDERTVLWCDPDLAIDWRVEQPIVSDKDAAGCAFHEIQPDDVHRFSY